MWFLKTISYSNYSAKMPLLLKYNNKNIVQSCDDFCNTFFQEHLLQPDRHRFLLKNPQTRMSRKVDLQA